MRTSTERKALIETLTVRTPTNRKESAKSYALICTHKTLPFDHPDSYMELIRKDHHKAEQDAMILSSQYDVMIYEV